MAHKKMHWELILGALGIFLGLPSFVAEIVRYVSPDPGQASGWIGIAYLFQNAVLICLFASTTILFRNRFQLSQTEVQLGQVEAEKWKQKYEMEEKRFARTLSYFSKNFHMLQHRKRDLLTNRIDPQRTVSAPDTCNCLMEYCNDIKHSLEYLHHEAGLRFNVTIKAICKSVDSGDFEAISIARHTAATVADNHRVNNTKRHNVKGNTAFVELLKVRPVVFASDNLPALVLAEAYVNTSDNWSARYNASIVIPIRKNNVGDGEQFELVGYLGVDTMMSVPGERSVFCHLNSNRYREDMADFLLAYGDGIYAILTRGRCVGPSGILGPMNYCLVNPDNFDFIQSIHREFLKKCSP